MKRWCVTALLASLLLSGACTRNDEERAKLKARQAGRELKEDLKDAGKELKHAGKEVKQGLEKAKRELNQTAAGADRKK